MALKAHQLVLGHGWLFFLGLPNPSDIFTMSLHTWQNPDEQDFPENKSLEDQFEPFQKSIQSLLPEGGSDETGLKQTEPEFNLWSH